MKTPIYDFTNAYANKDTVRVHMPGHKGQDSFCEALDITEIEGADSLFEANGIILESEKNASLLFGSNTFYSTEGSSLCIRAMIFLISLYAKETGRAPLIAAGRNAHKSFLSAIALNDTDVVWLTSEKNASYLSCPISADELDAYLNSTDTLPSAIYLTSPDYFGNVSDIKSIARVCHAHGVLLCVDNAHGAYLKFLTPSQHPIDLGADICCDSAHKTLPVLTGGAYLHISKDAPAVFSEQAKNALCLFGSTSPSYLILRSLDKANEYLEDHTERLSRFIPLLDDLRSKLIEKGYHLFGDEKLKITIDTKAYGYTGAELSSMLAKKNIVCEFADPEHLVLMFTPENSKKDIDRVKKALISINKKEPITDIPPAFSLPQRAMSAREAMLSPSERVPLDSARGRVLSMPCVSCPPAVPIVVSGERIDSDAINAMRYYGIDSCFVIKN